MKLGALEASHYIKEPNTSHAGILLFGADAMRVALNRQDLIMALIGPNGNSEMRLTRVSGADLRRYPAIVMDAMRAGGFFAGHRVLFIEDATDAAAKVLEAALMEWQAGDAQIVVTASNLTAKSILRKAFEARQDAISIGFYDTPPSKKEVGLQLAAVGLRNLPEQSLCDVESFAKLLDPGDFRQFLEKISLYKWGDDSPLSTHEIAALAPTTFEAAVDEVVNTAANRKASEVGLLMRRLEGQGVNAVTLCIGALRHFRTLHRVASDPSGPMAGIQKARGVHGPRRDIMLRQAQSWGLGALERALSLLVETDLTLRSTSRAPSMAVIERALLRLAMSKGG
ncbi:MAG: DNA polymerase III subunit delta [Paracoccaceae bacterium]|jgi:DNA polymerase-3 subunit delta